MPKRNISFRTSHLLMAALGLLLAATLFAIAFGGGGEVPEPEASVQEAAEFLALQEKLDPGEVRQVRNEIYQRKAEEKKEELISQLKKGELDPFPLFEDYALMGDSRAIGFYYNEYLTDERVIASGGHTILAIPGKLKVLKKLNPSYVFLCYGLNDVSIGYWDNGEEHAKEYMKNIAKIQEALPEATIVVSSILPTTKAAYSTSGSWKDIPKWNEALKAACREKGILFADCDWIYEKYSKLWVSDGYHFRPAVYPHWGGQLILTALYGEIDNES